MNKIVLKKNHDYFNNNYYEFEKLTEVFCVLFLIRYFYLLFAYNTLTKLFTYETEHLKYLTNSCLN